MKRKHIPLSVLILCTGALNAPFGAAQDKPRLHLPVDCISAPSCLVQNYVDLDPSPQRSDAFCEAATYDGHSGTDIRVRNIAEMNTGVRVLAVAAGVVQRVRDGERDRLIETPTDREAVQGKQCGNGVVIDHGNGWSSQTCHLKMGSVNVAPGDRVEPGTPIGLMGLSGDTEFPHVHVTIRQGDTVIDPFSGKAVGEACEAPGAKSMWDPRQAKLLAERDSPLVEAGFTGGPVTGLQLRKSQAPALNPGGPVVFYASFKNLQKGDTITINVFERGTRNPVASHTTDPLESPKATYTAYAGRRSPGYEPGAYVADVILNRRGKTIFRREFN
ncbi:MAG: M23 family metallopeptidase [Ahrensia sp.]|nr:M23 family metallopeptidase [Ahrensia sp.]